jgi:hypothetical protein
MESDTIEASFHGPMVIPISSPGATAISSLIGAGAFPWGCATN